MNQEPSHQTAQGMDKNPSFVSYADMLKTPKEIEIQPDMPTKPEKLITLKKKTKQ